MEQTNAGIIRQYLTNLRVAVVLAGDGRVGSRWRDIDYLPDYNKFYFIQDGEGWLKIDDREYSPRPGQLFLMPQGVRQSYSVTGPNTFTKQWCHFTARIGNLNLFDILRVPDFVEAGPTDLVGDLLAKIVTAFNQPELTATLRINAALLNLIAGYIEQCPIGKIRVVESEVMVKLNTILDFIEQNYHQNIAVDDLAAMAKLSPSYFTRLFRKQLGTSPIHYLNRRRIEAAKNLLVLSPASLTEIGERIGIADTYYFSRLFKEHTGFSPSAYRQMQRSG